MGFQGEVQLGRNTIGHGDNIEIDHKGNEYEGVRLDVLSIELVQVMGIWTR